jgi:hypothetical protein
MAFRVKRLVVASQLEFGSDVLLKRKSANTLTQGNGDTLDASGVSGGTSARLIIPNSGTAVGTGVPSTNGELLVTNRAAGSPVLVVRLAGTTFYTALTAA